MPRHKQTLEQLLPAKADRDKVEELLQMVRDPHQDYWGLGAERRGIDAAIGRVSKAADNLHFLRLLPVGFAAQVSLTFKNCQSNWTAWKKSYAERARRSQRPATGCKSISDRTGITRWRDSWLICGSGRGSPTMKLLQAF